MPKTYKNPPLLEAVCEFRFDTENINSVDQITNFYETIKALFPVQKKGKMSQLEVKIDMEKTPEENRKNISQDFYEFEQYYSSDEKYSVQLDGGRVSIHRIRPYTSWSEFFPIIQTVRDAYIKSFNPKSVGRIGIRYINEMVLPSLDFSFADYFHLEASIPSLEVNSRQSIFLGSVYEQNGGNDAIKVQFADKQQGDIEVKAFVLDLDYFLAKPIIQLDALDEWLIQAHTNIESVFEGIVTDKTKVIFDA